MKQFKTILNLRGEKQISGFLDKILKIREKSFIKDFGWIPITLYNEATQSKNEARKPFLVKWMATVDRFLKGEPILSQAEWIIIKLNSKMLLYLIRKEKQSKDLEGRLLRRPCIFSYTMPGRM